MLAPEQPVLKTCSGCGVTKSVTDYYLSSNRRGPRPKCKARHRSECRDRWHRSEATRERNYDGWLRRAYGITLEDYNAMLERQGGVCAICGDDPKVVHVDKGRNAQRLVLDHCHATGRIRGLLCGPCNRALAPLERDPAWVKRAIAYLDPAEALDVAPRDLRSD
jgi:hypothetical protein